MDSVNLTERLYEEAREEVILNERKLRERQQKINRLNRTEWQRWVPFIGFFRLAKDISNLDCGLLTQIHSTSYNMWNIGYNISVLPAISLLVLYSSKLLH